MNNELPPLRLPSRDTSDQSRLPAEWRAEPDAACRLSNQFDAPDSGAGRGFVSIPAALYRRKWAVIAFAVTGLAAGYLVSFLMRPVYDARLVLEIQQINDNFMNTRETMPVGGQDRSPLISDVLTQLRVLSSDHLIQRVLDQTPSYGKHVEQVLGGPGEPVRPVQIRNYLREALQMRSDPQTRIVDLTLSDTDPNFAAGFLNSLAERYIEENIESRSEMTHKTAEWLRRQVKDTRTRIERANDDLQRYARDSGLVFTAGHQSVAEDRLRQIQDALSKAQADRIERQARYQSVKDGKSDTSEMLADPTLRDYAQRLEDQRRQRAEMNVTYTPDYTKMKRLDTQIAALEAAFDKARNAVLEAVRKDYENAALREQMLVANYSAQSRLVTEEAARTVRYDLLKHEADSLQQSYESMLQRLKEVSLASAMQTSNIRVVDRAQVPYLPSSPKPILNALIGLLTGSLGAVAFALWREKWDTRIRAPGEMASMLRMPELGAIPKAHVHRQVATGSGRGRPLLSITNEAAADPTLSRLERNRISAAAIQESLLIDSCRAVLTSLFASGRHPVPRKLTVTSVSRGEGKTTITCNLGVTMARWKKRVLLIDGDFRSPQLHIQFDTKNENGLSDLLDVSLTDRSKRLMEWVRPTSVDGLYFLPSGANSSNQTDRLCLDTLPAVLEAAGNEFDLVFIDTPPVLNIPDARLFGRASDGVILVARAQLTETGALVAIADRLLEDGTVILGTILNDWDVRSDSRYSRYYRSSYTA